MIRALLVIILALAVGFGVQTWRIDRLKAAPVKERLKVVEKVVYRQAKAAQITEDISKHVAQREAEVRTVTRTIVEKVPVYVTAETDRLYDLPLGFVRLHDAAALGTPAVPFGAGESPDTPSLVEPSTGITVIAGNYGQCHVWREQVIGWQAWYAEQKAVWERP
jgi:hypothetical protein